MGYMLETRGLTKRFGRGDQAQDAVADVSLHIREGEVYGLLGPPVRDLTTSSLSTSTAICRSLRTRRDGAASAPFGASNSNLI